MEKSESTKQLIAAKLHKGITYQTLADFIGRDVVWTTSALLGQNSFDKIEAQKICELLELGKEAEESLQIFPAKGTTSVMPPTDPLIYRLYEIVLVYGDTIKEVIHEKAGDGIMSAIDFTMQIDKIENPLGDRIKIVLDGKFLPYKKW